LSKSCGCDLTLTTGQDHFKQLIKDCNVFINVSQLKDGCQEKLLRIAKESGMQGHVFNIGSIAEYTKWESFDPEYTKEKRQLREASLELCSENFKTTHVVVGGFQDSSNESPDRMDPEEIVKVIKFILSSSVNIPLVGVEKIKN
jgi:hypothetical protein